MSDTSILQDFLDQQVAAGAIPGAVAVIDRGGQTTLACAGAMSRDGAPMPPDAIMRIQSMTKPITAVATLRLVEAGRLSLEDPATRWLPELADRRVLTEPTGPLDRTTPSPRDITVHDLLTNQSGYGIPTEDCPLLDAMRHNGTEATAEPVSLGADEWVARLADLPLAFAPGEGWRYHHSFGLLGILLSRLTGRPLGEHLAEDIFAPIGMPDTGFWVPADDVSRLPAAYRRDDDGLVETEPAAGGFYAGPPPFDVSHAELVSTAADFAAFCGVLARGGTLPDGTRLLSPEQLTAMTTNQVPPANQSDDSFFPGFWTTTGWGFGVGIETAGEHVGRYGWAGGQGTDFYVDPGGGFGIILTQVELGPGSFQVINAFRALA